MKLISTIAADLKQTNPEIGCPTAQDLNNMLLVKGLIYNTPKGKLPTAAGRQKGIGKRIGIDSYGHEYAIPEYDRQAEQYVKSLAIKYFSEIAEQVAAPLVSGDNSSFALSSSNQTNISEISSGSPIPVYQYTHRDYDSIKSRYRDHLVILEGPVSYWTYFQDARKLSQLMGWDVYFNHRSIPGIAFQKDQLSFVEQTLDQNRVEWIVYGLENEQRSAEYSPVSEIELPETRTETVMIGSYVKVCINDSEIKSFFIRDGNSDPVIAQVSKNGLVISTDFSEFEEDSVTVDSSAGSALLGRIVGDIVQVVGGRGDVMTYHILEIK